MEWDEEQLRRDAERLGLGPQPLRDPFDRALEVCIRFGGEDSRKNWKETLEGAQSFADQYIRPGDDELPAQDTGFLGFLLLSYLGEMPPAALIREVEKRADELPLIRSGMDAHSMRTDEVADAVVTTLRAALRVSKEFSPVVSS
jgi:hypothetical protein